MNFKALAIKTGKIIISLILAFIILNMFCLLYFNAPEYYICEDGATDFRWKPNAFFMEGSEGFSCGKTNNEGYLNLYDYKEGMPIDVLIMGSSHMEAYQVDMKKSVSSVLDSMLQDKNVYNIGAASHNFLTCALNLKAAVKKYQPRQYIVIEAMKLDLSDYDLTRAIEGNFDISDLDFNKTGLLGAVKRNNFIKLFRHQLNEYIDDSEFVDFLNKNIIKNIDEQSEYSPLMDSYNNYELLNTIFSDIKKTADESGAKIIILYHPSVFLQKDGSVYVADLMDEDKFIKVCDENGIIFLNMKERFFNEYKKDFSLPYGFTNSSIGSGHLNANGHRMIADELFSIIEEGK